MTPFARAQKKKNGSSNAASNAARALVTNDERVVSARP
jgi:hypothetical protein